MFISLWLLICRYELRKTVRSFCKDVIAKQEMPAIVLTVTEGYEESADLTLESKSEITHMQTINN